MILQALTEYYEMLLTQANIKARPPQPGWSQTYVRFAVYIDLSGVLKEITLLEDETNKKGRLTEVPLQLKRSGTKPPPYFLCDTSAYVLGIDKDGRVTERSKAYFSAFSEYNKKILLHINCPEARAVINFFDRWDVNTACSNPSVQKMLSYDLSKGNLAFYITNTSKWVLDAPNIRAGWSDFYRSSSSQGPSGVCLVTGKNAPVARIHNSVKGIYASSLSPNGWTLVSFDKGSPAFSSYGKEQGYNAPTSEYAAFAYTAALNHLLADRDHIFHIGDATVVCWARSGERGYQDVFQMFFSDFYSETDLKGLVGSLCQGNPVVYDETKLDPNMDFYILGLSPNAARLSVRFFLRNTFGGFLSCVQDHYNRLAIVPSRFDQREFTPVWRLLYATIRSQLKFEPESFESARPQLEKNLAPNLAGEVLRSILTGMRYPSTLYNNVLLRIFAEQKVDRTRAAIIKAYLLKNHPDKTGIREEMNLPINYNEEGSAFLLGCLFALLEKIQIDAIEGINQTLVDKFLPTAASTPHLVFDSLLEKSRYHLRKLGGKYGHRKDLQELLCAYHQKQPGGFPQHLSHTERGDFLVGYYLKNQELWQSKSEQKKEETKDV